MGDRAFYVWGSFGAVALAMIVEVVLLRMRLKKVKK
jgi:heme exporter protein CcmD